MKEFIGENNRLPSVSTDRNNRNNKFLGIWCSNQKRNYDSDIQRCRSIMKNHEIKEKWEEFMEENSNLFPTPEEYWINNLEK